MMTTAQQAAHDLFANGTPPDGQPWHGGFPRISVDFTSSEVVVLSKTQNPNGSITWDVVFTFGGGGGITCDSILISRFQRAFPDGAEALATAFHRVVGSQLDVLQAEVANWFSTQTWKPFAAIVGYQEYLEYDTPHLDRIDANIRPVFGTSPKVSRMTARLPFSIRATITATPLQAVDSIGPLSAMPDHEVDALIREWASQSPETFYMDGELQLSYADAVRHYRTAWRNLTPRQQTNLLANLQRISGR